MQEPIRIVGEMKYFACPCGGEMCVTYRSERLTPSAPRRPMSFVMCKQCGLEGGHTFDGPNEADRLFEASAIETCLPCGGVGCDECNHNGRVVVPGEEEG